jgi:hypothetical protein
MALAHCILGKFLVVDVLVYVYMAVASGICSYGTAHSESRCALRLRYIDLFVNIEVAVAVCCCFTVFSC